MMKSDCNSGDTPVIGLGITQKMTQQAQYVTKHAVWWQNSFLKGIKIPVITKQFSG
jgi:hypothetical protein